MHSDTHQGYILVLTTCPDQEVATNIAAALVSERLAACVNILSGVKSVYRWQGKIEYDEEHSLVIKTRSEAYKNLEQRIRQLHPYELPEIIAVSIDAGLEGYLHWIDESVDKE